MYCKKCGKEINDDAVVCVHCGCAVEDKKPAVSNSQDFNTPKTGMGVLLGLLLGLVGLLIGVLIYPEGTVARKTFIKAWGITFGITIGVSIIIGAISGVVMAGMYNSMGGYY